jgi:CheY-like chemotaxis protein
LARKILLADDSVTAQNMGRRILIDAGYEVITVNNGSAALKKIAEQKPDLIILDVYMPGYGGLELCQRLREGRDTARTPILLTVGKLEPFKADEARRVRADAYIVKPFEATELLTALTKLEDKIVPRPDPYKPGRFAKAFAAIDEGVDPAVQAAEVDENSWKDRLRIPAGPKLVEQSNGGKASRGRKEKAEKAREERKNSREPEAANIPADITPEEMSAIAAAAAALNGTADSALETAAANVEPEVVHTATDAPESTLAPTPAEPAPAEPMTFASSPEEQLVPAAPESPAPNPSEVIAAEPAKSEPEVATAGKTNEAAVNATAEAPQAEKPTDAEVLAALATLGVNDDAPAAQPVAGAEFEVAVARGPRWVAEEISVSDEEGTFILEREMEKAYAALAAVEGTFATFAVDSASPAAPMEVPSQQESLQSEANPEASITSAPAEIADAVSVTTVSSDTPVESPVQPSQPAQQESAAVEVREEVAMAVAAGAEIAGGEPATKEPVPSNAEPVALETARGEGVSRSEADLVAAWANWKHIRESVMSPAAETLEAEVSPDLPAAQPSAVETEPPAAAVTAQPAPSSGDTETIASIVDNMLAELKPRLMEELAKKLAQEKSKADR